MNASCTLPFGMYHVVFTYRLDIPLTRGRNRLGISLPRVVARGIPGHGRHNGTRARALRGPRLRMSLRVTMCAVRLVGGHRVPLGG